MRLSLDQKSFRQLFFESYVDIIFHPHAGYINVSRVDIIENLIWAVTTSRWIVVIIGC